MDDSCLVVGCGYLGSRVAALWRGQGRRVFALTRSRGDELRSRRTGPRGRRRDAARHADGAAARRHRVVRRRPGPRRGEVDARRVRRRTSQRAGRPAGAEPPHLRQQHERLRPVGRRMDRRIGTHRSRRGERQDGARRRADAAGRPAGRGGFAVRRHLRAEPRVAEGGDPGRRPARRRRRQVAEPDPRRGRGRAVLAAERAAPGSTYNVSDGTPVRRRDFYAHMAELLGARQRGSNRSRPARRCRRTSAATAGSTRAGCATNWAWRSPTRTTGRGWRRCVDGGACADGFHRAPPSNAIRRAPNGNRGGGKSDYP